MEAVNPSETSVNFYSITRCHILVTAVITSNPIRTCKISDPELGA
jgi:hypothetical protein